MTGGHLYEAFADHLVKQSSSNPFLDLGFPPEEAAILQMRAEIMADLRKFIKAKKLTQAKAAGIFGVERKIGDVVSIRAFRH